METLSIRMSLPQLFVIVCLLRVGRTGAQPANPHNPHKTRPPSTPKENPAHTRTISGHTQRGGGNGRKDLFGGGRDTHETNVNININAYLSAKGVDFGGWPVKVLFSPLIHICKRKNLFFGRCVCLCVIFFYFSAAMCS